MYVVFLYIIILVAQWFVYIKMGREGWEGVLPFYNAYVLFEVLYGNGWNCLLILVPFYGLYIAIKAYIDLAHVFNKSTAFGWGLVLLGFVFMPVLGLSKDIQYGDGRYSIDPSKGYTYSQSHESLSDVDLLIKYKELLDIGAITQDEFDKKKKELLRT